jgi:PAS domain S-box-containing protein
MKKNKAVKIQINNEYEKFFNLSNDLFCIAGLDGNFKLLNPAFEKVLGYTGEELLAKPFYDIVHPEDRESNLAEMQCLLNGLPVVYCEHRYICKDGSCKWLAWSVHTDMTEGLIYAVGRDVTAQRLAEQEISSLKKHFLEVELQHKSAFTSIITRSRKMTALFHYIEAVAGYRKPILITGETGVGKELVAKSIHQVSGVKGAFTAVNVAGLDDTMFSDTLFGHRKGAYTGAEKDRDGLIVRAAGGTLLLDEIGDLNEASQVKLLRLLEEQMYYPLGSDVPEKGNARIIASSNQDMHTLISEGSFRKDLYYRLCSHHIHIPPLRERLEDIPGLLDYFIDDAAKSQHKKKPTPPSELVILLSNYNFPGNVRELKAMVFDAVAQHKSGMLSMDSFKSFIKQKGASSKTDTPFTVKDNISMLDIFGHFPTLKETEDYVISDALKRADGNQGIAADLLGMTRQALNNRLKRKDRNS